MVKLPVLLLAIELFFLGCINQKACTKPTTSEAKPALTITKTHSEEPDGEQVVISHPYTMVQIQGRIDPDSAAIFKRKILEAAATHEYVTIEFNTGGGLTEDGFLVAKTIEECGKPTICIVDGYTQSYGVFLLESCTVRAMTYRSFLMIHQAHYNDLALGSVNYDELLDWANRVHSTDYSMFEHFALKMHMTPDEIAKKVDNREWYLRYKEAVKVGAVDAAFPTVKEAVETLTKPKKTK